MRRALERRETLIGATLSDWVPCKGQLSIGEAAVMAEAMHALARAFAKPPTQFGNASICARVAIWLDRELAKVDTTTLFAGERTTLSLPPELTRLAEELDMVKEELRYLGESYEDFLEPWLRLIVATGVDPFASEALVDLGDAALHRSRIPDAPDPSDDVRTAIACYEQVDDHRLDPELRVRALYGAAQTHLIYGENDWGDLFKECAIAYRQLQSALFILENNSLEVARDAQGGFVTSEKITGLLATTTNHLITALNANNATATKDIEGLS